MADINELISQKALDDIQKLESSIDKIAKGLYAIFDAAKASNAAISSIKPTELDKIAASQKKVAENAKALGKEEEKLAVTMTKKTKVEQQANKEATEAIKKEKERIANMAALDKQRQKALEQLAKAEAAEKEAQLLMESEARTIEELRKQNSLLRKERDRLDITTEEGAEAIAELNKRLNENEEAIRSNLDAAGKQRANIGNYKEDVKAALAETGLFSEQINKLNQIKKVLGLLLRGNTAAQAAQTAATEAGTTAQNASTAASTRFAGAMKVVRIAVAATGIGLLVLAIASLISYFRATEEGANRLQKILAPIAVTFGNIRDIATRLGGALVSLFSGERLEAQRQFNDALGKTRDLYSDTNKEVRARLQLLDDELALKKYTRAATVAEAQLQAAIQADRLKAEELKGKDEKRSIAALESAINKERALLSIQETRLSETLRLAKANADLNDTNEEGLNEIAQLEADLIALKGGNAQREKELVAQLREARTRDANAAKVLIAEQVKAQEEADKKVLEMANTLNKATADLDYNNMLGREATATELVERKKQLLIKEVEDSTASEKAKQQAITAIIANAEAEHTAIRLKGLADLKAISQESADTILAIEEELIKEIEDENEKLFQATVKLEEKNRAEAEKTAKARLQGQQMVADAAIELGTEVVNAIFEINRRSNEAEIAELEGLRDKKIITEEQYDSKLKAIRAKQARRDRAQAIFNASITTAEAVVKALSSTVPPFNFILASLVGALGAVQIGLIASQPLPAFAAGTDRAPEGLARVAERGRELLVNPDGTMQLTGNKEEIRYLAAGTKVIPNRKTEEILQSGARVRTAGDSVNGAILRKLNTLRSISIVPDKAKIVDRKGRYFTTYINAKIR